MAIEATSRPCRFHWHINRPSPARMVSVSQSRMSTLRYDSSVRCAIPVPREESSTRGPNIPRHISRPGRARYHTTALLHHKSLGKPAQCVAKFSSSRGVVRSSLERARPARSPGSRGIDPSLRFRFRSGSRARCIIPIHPHFIPSSHLLEANRSGELRTTRGELEPSMPGPRGCHIRTARAGPIVRCHERNGSSQFAFRSPARTIPGPRELRPGPCAPCAPWLWSVGRRTCIRGPSRVVRNTIPHMWHTEGTCGPQHGARSYMCGPTWGALRPGSSSYRCQGREANRSPVEQTGPRGPWGAPGRSPVEQTGPPRSVEGSVKVMRAHVSVGYVRMARARQGREANRGDGSIPRGPFYPFPLPFTRIWKCGELERADSTARFDRWAGPDHSNGPRGELDSRARPGSSRNCPNLSESVRTSRARPARSSGPERWGTRAR